MKRLVILTCLMVISLSSFAQFEQRHKSKSGTVVKSQHDNNKKEIGGASNSETTSDDKTLVLNDYMFSYAPDSKMFSLRCTYDLSDLGYLNCGFKMAFSSNSSYTPYLGLGLKKRFLIGNFLMLSAHVGPYMGLSVFNYEVPVEKKNSKGGVYTTNETKNKCEFTYGLLTEIKAGIKLGKSWGLTAGYYMGAGKFKFDNFFKGSWAIGVTAGF